MDRRFSFTISEQSPGAVHALLRTRTHETLASVRGEDVALKTVQMGVDDDITKPVDMEYLQTSNLSNTFNLPAESFSGLQTFRQS